MAKHIMPDPAQQLPKKNKHLKQEKCSNIRCEENFKEINIREVKKTMCLMGPASAK